MTQYERFRDDFLRTIDRDWVKLALIVWVVVAVWLMSQRWLQVQALGLGDTDDNMRLMQVRALLNGQAWYDLRNYRMDPPGGFDIHWSRIVDLPIAGLILALRPLLGTPEAERIACGIAPIIPLAVAFVGLGATVRRLVDPRAWPVAVALLVAACGTTMLMFSPDRIDHHGWQLAMLSLTVTGLSDPRRARGGAIVGAASAFSLSIGLEMLPYAAMAGAIIALQWLWDRTESARVQGYALTLAGGTAIGYAGFASYANSVMRCDALTPVYLTMMIAAGGLLFVLAWINPAARWLRFVLAIAAAGLLAWTFVHYFPQCLGRPEQVSPELERNWLDNVREAKPIYAHTFRQAFPVVAFPVIGLLGAVIGATRAATARAANMVGWIAVALFTLFACLMLLWQARAGPAAQMLAVPGGTALIWIVVPRLWRSGNWTMRVAGTAAVVMIVSGSFSELPSTRLWQWFSPPGQADTRRELINKAGARCPYIGYLSQIDRYPKATVLSFVDLGPRIITVTHHDAVAGPYHRNGDAILDVQHAFTGTPEQFRAIAKKHGATLLLVCPNMAESTVYRARSPGGFYDQLAHNRRFPFLKPLPLPKGSPLRLFRIE